MPGVFVMELVYYRLNESGLVMDGQNGVGGNIDPVFCSTVSMFGFLPSSCGWLSADLSQMSEAR
jgi:hypothetical protein